MSSYVNRLPSSSPKPLPMPENCRLNYSAAYGYAVCQCRTFSILSCPSRETATAIWNIRHMLADPGPVEREQRD